MTLAEALEEMERVDDEIRDGGPEREAEVGVIEHNDWRPIRSGEGQGGDGIVRMLMQDDPVNCSERRRNTAARTTAPSDGVSLKRLPWVRARSLRRRWHWRPLVCQRTAWLAVRSRAIHLARTRVCPPMSETSLATWSVEDGRAAVQRIARGVGVSGQGEHSRAARKAQFSSAPSAKRPGWYCQATLAVEEMARSWNDGIAAERGDPVQARLVDKAVGEEIGRRHFDVHESAGSWKILRAEMGST